MLENAISRYVWEKKYKKENENTLEETLERVINYVFSKKKDSISKMLREKITESIISMKFLPAGRIIAYSDTHAKKGTLSNCYVIGRIQDSMEDIMEKLKDSALTMKAGGGIGIDFSGLRPNGSYVNGTESYASGPVSFMKMWNTMSETISGTGHRKGAMIATLSVEHPDVEEFIFSKKDNSINHQVLEKFNISVKLTDEFMNKVYNDEEFELRFNNKVYKKINARELIRKIAESAHRSGEPGILYIDTINRLNNLWYCETINCVNPCGEEPLPDGGSCNLGAINLTQFVKDPFGSNPVFDFQGFSETVAYAVNFLDMIIDVNYYPLSIQEKEAKEKRRVGLGVMGLGSMLAMMKMRYGSETSLKFVEEIMRVMMESAYISSIEIAKREGSFKLFDAEQYLYRNPESFVASRLPAEVKKMIEKYGIRNSHLLAIAPTGSISQLANCVSGGVEPIFSLFYKRVNYGEEQIINDFAYNIYRQKYGDVNGDKPDFLVTARELTYEDHLKMVAVVQKYVDSAVSKTVNMPNKASIEEVENVYKKAYEMGLKGCTVYREGSLDYEILREVNTNNNQKSKEKEKKKERPYVLSSKTYKVKIPGQEHAYYLTFSYDDESNKPLEFFINTKDSSVEDWTKLVGRIVSSIFKEVKDPSFLIDEFRQIKSATTGFFSSMRKRYVPSLQAEFGEVMNDFFKEINFVKDKDKRNEMIIETIVSKMNEMERVKDRCPECETVGSFVKSEGCGVCMSCGYSICS